MFLIGSWKSLDELESSLTQEELFALLKAQRERRKEEHVFLAALQGVDLEGAEVERKKKEIEERAQRRINANYDRDELVDLGIELIE